MATTTNFGWETPDDTDLVKDGAAAIRTALGGVDTSFVDLKGGTTGQVLAKASNTDLDFTWSADASGIPATIFDAKGDLIAASAADTAARLAVGTNGQVLTVNSAQSTGLEWTTLSTGAMTLLSTTSLTGSSTTISSISGSYNDLWIYCEDFVPDTNDVTLSVRFNSDTGSKYTLPNWETYYSATTLLTSFKIADALSNTASDRNFGVLSLPGYANAYHKVAIFQGTYNNKNTGAAYYAGANVASYYASTTAISSITFLLSAGNFSTGTVKIYGVK